MMHDHRCSTGLQGNLFPLGIDVRLGHVDPEQRVKRAIETRKRIAAFKEKTEIKILG
jgi:hypothetical protein